MSGKAFDELDDFVAPEAVVAGEFEEVPGLGQHRPSLGGAGHADTPSAPELKRVSDSRFRRLHRRFNQAMVHAFPVRQGAQVTTTTVTFSAIGQPQHITAPRNALSYRESIPLTGRQH